MAKPKPKKRRFTYTAHSDEKVYDAVRMAIPEGGIFWDYLSGVGMEPIGGNSEWERGKCEGRRELAGELLSMAMNESQLTVEKNVK